MDFYTILDQVITLLQQRGKASYRALQLQFQLDDASLDVLKDELIKVHQLARDQDGEMLVWTGDTAPAQAVASHPAQPTQQPAIQAQQAPQAPEAERRQLTVMFCDLVDSTQLSSQLDPEEYREVVRAYQQVCSEVITRFDGHIAQLLGDGLLVYFGYPQAHEDDAQRALRAGLDMLAAMAAPKIRLQQETSIHLALRIGIHTGLVVVGAMGGQGRHEQLALGETPNIAARIQGLAAPNTVAISAATYRLAQGYFACEALGAQTLRGVGEPLTLYRVLRESGAHNRLEIVSARGLTPLVGREQEVAILLERWAQVKAGHGHVVLLTGDAGIGKSRLVQMLKDHVTHEPHMRWECRSAEYSQNTALFPLVELFQRLLRFDAHETPDAKLAQLEHALSQYRLPLEESVPLFAPLLSLSLPASRYAPLTVSPQRQRQKTLETIIAILLELAEHHPVLFILEDLHWTDPSTLELLGLLLDQTPTASLLVLLTCRPHFQPAWHHRSYLTEMTVHRLARHQIEQMTTHVAGGKTFPPAVMHQLVERTDGVPLFIEEMTKAMLESGHLQAVDAHYALTGAFATFAIPATLQDSLMARLDHLGTAKAVAQYAAVIGRQCSYAWLHACAPLDAATLQQELHRLVEAELVYQRGVPPQATYTFKHALIQDTAYESLLKSTRQQYHQRIAQVLEAQFPETAEAQPELLAQHYTEAGLTEQAVPYWQLAGQRAIERSAHVEAVAHLRQGLAFLPTLPETPERTRREVDMLIALGVALNATQGYAAPEVAQTYLRARQLCARLDDLHQRFSLVRGLWVYYLLCADLQTAHALSEQLLDFAQQAQDTAMLMTTHQVLGATLYHRGAVASAYTYDAQGIALYDAQQHRTSAFLYGEDSGVICHSHAAWELWYLGSPDQGLAQSQQAVALAQQIDHPFSLGFAWGMTAMFHQFRREMRAAQERTEAAISLTTEQGFPYWMTVGAMLRGWALARQGQAQEGIEQITQGLLTYRATGAELLRPYFLALLAEAHSVSGQPEAGLPVLTEALALVDTTGERWCEPELYRLKGALLLQQHVDNQPEAERCFRHAIAIAQTQQAKSLELRATTSLARLWQQQGKRREAYDLLAPVYHWFTEGFDTADLQEARALLDTLA